jgi:hypothetical protein
MKKRVGERAMVLGTQYLYIWAVHGTLMVGDQVDVGDDHSHDAAQRHEIQRRRQGSQTHRNKFPATLDFSNCYVLKQNTQHLC